jgi:hypothetical protein
MRAIRVIGVAPGVMAAGLSIPAAAQAQGIDLTAAYQFQQVSCSGCDGTSIPGGFSADLAGRLSAGSCSGSGKWTCRERAILA